MTKKYLDCYVSLGILAGIIVLLWVLAIIFLSSIAEAHRGDVTKPVPIPHASPVWRVIDVGPRTAALYWEVPRTPFERPQEPVRFILQWPQLPTVAETHIKLAQERLQVYMAVEIKNREEAHKSLQNKVEAEELVKTLAFVVLLLGIFLTVLGIRYRRG